MHVLSAAESQPNLQNNSSQIDVPRIITLKKENFEAMSGFEVAGVVLGSVPLLISAIQYYAKGIATMKRTAKYKAQADDLVVDLIWAHSSLRNTCEKLLSRLQLSDEEVIFLIQNLNGLAWSSPALDERIQRALRSDYKASQGLLLRIFAKLDQMRETLGLPEDYASSADYTPMWFKTREKPGARDRITNKLTKAGKAVQLGFEGGQYSKMFQAVRNDIEGLEKILRDSVELEPVRYQRSTRRNVRAWAAIRDFAASLFRSIRWDCECSYEHIANLRLEMRKRLNYEETPLNTFNLLFSYTKETATFQHFPWVWRQVMVEPSEIENQRGTVSFAITPRAITLPGSSIQSLCDALKNAPELQKSVGFIGCDRYRHHIITSAREEQRTTRTLEDILKERNSQRLSNRPRLCDYTTKERYQISLTLAYTVLQFYGTPWLQDIWSKKDIYFIGSHQSLVDSLYLVQKPVPRQKGQQLTGLLGLRPWANPTTYALGIVLLELAFGFPLEAVRSDSSDLGPGGQPDALTDFRKASRLALMIEERDGEGLATTIIKCMRYDAFEPEDSRFQECFYNDVIAPLETCLGYMQ
ncbi:hypothetical protein VTL71DRAFT_12230 [Oculimacula yallundae]|uniref:DUF7580 domain-containing protein n=1 Tax=Oculimacula yallundae TaxID=86028 RepID=A0ABR4CTH6_9HELO